MTSVDTARRPADDSTAASVHAAPRVPFLGLRSVWFQVTGTLCNLACRHCFNTSGPRDPWLGGLDVATVRRYVAEAEQLGVPEFYFTGGEPLMHPDIVVLLEAALAVAPTTVLTNGTLVDEALADTLARVAASSAYSLEIRISLDAPTPGENDAVRGRGSFARAVRAVRLLAARSLHPIVTATEIAAPSPGASLYERLRGVLLEHGADRPRVRFLPLLPIGRCSGGRDGPAPHGGGPRELRPGQAAVHGEPGRGRGRCVCVSDPGGPAGRAPGHRPACGRAGPDPALSRSLPHLPRDRTRVPELLNVRRIALLGGIYANAPALEEALSDARRRGAEAIACLGDLRGLRPASGPGLPPAPRPGVLCVQGNYDLAVAQGADDCGCGYTDPRDNHFARISYSYTVRATSTENRRWLGALPPEARIVLGERRLLLCHGSPRQINESLWESTTPNGLLERFCRDTGSDVLGFTHTGTKWHRALPSGRHAINVGVLGRPENDGTPRVWYTLLTADRGDLVMEFVPVEYDHEALAREMTQEGLPGEFVETVRTGWWNCCLESMPVKERPRGRF